MKTNIHAVILGIVAVLSVLGCIILPAIGRPIPDVLAGVALAAASAIGGIALPNTGATTQAAADNTPAPQPAAAADHQMGADQ